LIEEDTIMSGNTFGATFWTDGKRDAPMLPEQPWFVKCPHCQALLWIDELKEIGKVDWFSNENNYKDAKPYDTPVLHDYIAELKKQNLGKEKELYLRLRAWWAGNDRRRDIGNEKIPLSKDEQNNLQALYESLDSSDENDRIMMAEIQRERGKFKEAEELLQNPFSNELLPAASIIKNLIRKRDPFVAEMQIED
jgi:hypothetical protein